MVSPNAIERVLNSRDVVEKYGPVYVKEMISKYMDFTQINDDTDDPMPEWAVQMLKTPGVGYRTRIHMCMTHHFDITNTCPCHCGIGLTRKEMEDAPPKYTKEFVELRERKEKEAEEFIRRRYSVEQEEEKQKEKKEMGEEYQKYEFVGRVYRVGMANKYGRDIYVSTHSDDAASKYPQHMMFTVSAKKMNLVPEVKAGDKVKIMFMPMLSEGVSERTRKEYSINKNHILEMAVIESAPEKEDESKIDPEDVPF